MIGQINSSLKKSIWYFLMGVCHVDIVHFQGSPQTMEWWRSAAILLAQCHYIHFE